MPKILDNNQQVPPEDICDDDEINLIDLIYPIFKLRKFLVIFCFSVAVLVGIISVFSERIYEAKAVILPETNDEGGDIGVKAAFMEQFGITGLGGSNTTSSAIFGAVLKSNELAWEVLNRYDFFSTMGISNDYIKEKIAKDFAKRVKVSESKDDPVLVSDITNSYVHALDRYNLENSFTSARRLREYIENRLKIAEEELDKAQKKLQEFQEKNKAISIGKQAEATLEVLAEMESQKVALEVDKAAKEKTYGGSSREIEQLDAQIEAINKNINRLTYSEELNIPIESEKGKVEFYIPLTRIPALNYDESKLLLKVKAKTAVITMLTTQLEQAKLDEAKDIPTINVLEQALPPEFSKSPNIKLNIALSMISSLLIGIIFIFFMEFSKRMDRDPEFSFKWKEIKQAFMFVNYFKKKKWITFFSRINL